MNTRELDQQDVIIEVGRKGGYVPVISAGGPPPGDPGLAQSPQVSPSNQPNAQAPPQLAPQTPTPVVAP
jgi:hypothetical protein